MKTETLKYKVGQKVRTAIPVNGTIVKVTDAGYEIEVKETGGTYRYFDDCDVYKRK